MSSKSPPETVSPPRAHVKKENEEEIKEFAETAMNELLGWYGYERLELRRWAASRARDASSPEGLQSADHKSKDECSWCNKSMSGEGAGAGGALQQAGATFCSELCFSQSRRANFKRAKTCDWCRHVRHTVAYVDFQDGATQLQFCSDKCLNQYKMHIFCRETQAHLDLNPHLVNAASSSNLITPELWLKNCKSRSASPVSERSASPTADSVPIKPTTETEKAQRKSPLPLITVAPPAKLMKPKRPSEERPSIQRSPEGKKEMKTNKMNLRKRRTSKCSATVTSQSVRHSATPKAQDLRMCSPVDGASPASTGGNTATHSPPHPMPPPLPPPTFPNAMFGMPAPLFMDNGHGPANDYRLPNMYPPRHNFMPRPGISMHQNVPRLPPPMSFPSQTLGQAPPVTVLVPYPVILPIPVPIPVPIPLTSFLQAHLSNKVVKTEVKGDDAEGPLDFTMNGKKDEPTEVTNEGISEASEVKESSAEANIVNERIEDKTESDTQETANPEQTLPKFKITRIGNKMAKIVPKNKEQSESMRPLRKRRRLVEGVAEDDPLIPKRKTVQV